MQYGTVLALVLLCWMIPVTGVAGETDTTNVANSHQPFYEAFALKFTQPPVAKGQPTIYEQAGYDFYDIPSIARAPDGRLFLAWCASVGFARANRIVGAYSRDGGRTWDPPIELINTPDRDDGDPVIVVDGQRLLVISSTLRLPDRYDKFNPWPVKYDRIWWYMTSTEDGGKTWSKPVEVEHPHAYAGKRDKGYRLPDGTLVLPYYYDPSVDRGNVPPLEGDIRGVAAMANSRDGGVTWTSGRDVSIPGSKGDVYEPATVRLSNGETYCLLRTNLDRLYETRSRDDGLTWDTPKPSPLPAHSAPAGLHRLENRPGDELVVAWDNSTTSGRWPLAVAYSPDGGKTWSAPKLISNPNPQKGYRADYPTLCETKEGLIVLVWQEETLPRHLGKELRIARFNRAWLIQK